MCNLYNVTKGPQAILEFTRAMLNNAGNLEPGKIYPDYPAPIVRAGADGARELARALEVVVVEDEPQSFENRLATDVIELMVVFSARLYGARSHRNRAVST